MNKMWIIARKDILEAFRNRSTYFYIAVLFFLTFTYFSSYNAMVNRLVEEKATQEVIIHASLAFMNNILFALPLMYAVLICSIFAAYSVILDKAKRNLESLMVTPVSLNQIWLGKSIAVTLPSVVIALVVTIAGYIIMNFIAVIPRTGVFVYPDILTVITAVILVPLLIFGVVTVVIFVQLIMANPRVANLVYTLIFLFLFFGINILTQMGIVLNYAIIYAGLFVVSIGISYFLSRFLTKERVILSSKG